MSLFFALTKQNSVAAPVRAFPGAQGLAANTRGAAGYSGAKSVAIVDSLADSGTGSFRAAVEGTGKEGTFVVFATSGIIELLTPLEITSDYITIFGQTSPGGICTAGSLVQIGDSGVGNSDVIVQHMRFRPGSHIAGYGSDAEAFRVWSASNVMIDHCSMSWGGDETCSVTAYGGTECANITFSHCMITQGLDLNPAEEHAYGLLFNFNAGTGNSGEIHNSMIAHMNGECRMPKCAGDGFYNIVNNVIYNYDKFYTMQVSTDNTAEINMVGNYVKEGPNSEGVYTGAGRAAEAVTSATFGGTAAEILFMENNFGLARTADSDSEWAICDYNNDVLLSTDWQSSTEFTPPAGVAITKVVLTDTDPEGQADTILADCGATKPSRDTHDAAMVTDFENATGTFPSDRDYDTTPGDWPTYSTPSPPTDTNSDGIADSWDSANMGGDAWDDVAPSGYLWIEEYVHDQLS